MAQLVKGLTLGSVDSQERSLRALWRLRLALGWTILFGALIDLFAVSWDIQWHSAVGRDRTLTAPHLFILVGIALMGIVALAAVLIETAWARHRPSLAQSSTRFAGTFSSSLGAYLVGYGALASAIAFPIDQYWHTLYGIDVSIWAPFHIMALTGLSLNCLGVAYMLAEGAHLAERNGAKGAARAGYIGVIVALATLMGVFSFLLVPAIENQGYISLGSLTFTVYPLMLGAFGMFVLIAAMQALPWRAVATSVAVVYAFFGLLNYVLIPPLMSLNLYFEQQSLLPRAPTVSVIAVAGWQYTLVIAAVLLDVAIWLARRGGWSLQRVRVVTIVAALVGVSLAALFSLTFLTSAEGRGVHTGRIIASAAPKVVRSVASSSPTGLDMSSLVIVVISLLLGLLGAYVGVWLGRSIGDSMRGGQQ